MKDRISNIKTHKRFSIIPVIIVLTLVLTATGCALTKTEKVSETSDPAEDTVATADTSETTSDVTAPSESQEPPVTEPSEEPAPTSGLEPTILKIPDIGTLEDGQYTCTMTPLVIEDTESGETVVLFPWTQVEVDQDYIDSLKVGDEVEIPEGNDFPEDSTTVASLNAYTTGEHIHYGTTYSGEVICINDNNEGLSFRKTVSGTWKLFWDEMPVTIDSEPMRLVVSPDVKIYDGYHPGLYGWPEDMTNEEVTAFVEFRDTTLSEGYVDSIEAFFEEDAGFMFQYGNNITLQSYSTTVITVEDNTITEVYFWYHP